MIFTNEKMTGESRQMTFGTLFGYAIGEIGRGRKEVFIPAPESVPELQKGINQGVSIGLTKSGKARINVGESGNFVILSSAGGYTRRGNGIVESLKSNPVRGIDKAYGADGAAGRIGSWDVIIAELPDETATWIRVRRSGGNPSDLVYWDGVNCHLILNEEIEYFCDNTDISLPFSFEERGFRREEWV